MADEKEHSSVSLFIQKSISNNNTTTEDGISLWINATKVYRCSFSIKKKIQNYKQKLRRLCELQKERDRVYRQGKGLLHHESPLSKNVTFDKITDKSTILVS